MKKEGEEFRYLIILVGLDGLHAYGGLGLPVVEVEGVVVVVVRLDRVQVEEDVVELLQEEEAGGHALPPRDRVALRGGAPDQLEILLGNLQVLSGAVLLPHRGVDHPFQDVLLK